MFVFHFDILEREAKNRENKLRKIERSIKNSRLQLKDIYKLYQSSLINSILKIYLINVLKTFFYFFRRIM